MSKLQPFMMVGAKTGILSKTLKAQFLFRYECVDQVKFYSQLQSFKGLYSI
jgi:hypothetical protein